MERKKKVMTASEAVKELLKPGQMLAVGGMHMHNNPMGLVRELIRQRVKVKTLVTSPSACINADLLIGADLVEEIICSYVGFEHLGLAPCFRRAVEQNKLKVREADEISVTLGLRAGAGSLPFVPFPRGMEAADTSNVNKEDYAYTKDPFTGGDVLCGRAIQPDVALVHCQKSDVYGNAIFEGSIFTDLEMIKASEKVILQVEEIVGNDYIEENARRVAVPSMLVDAVVPLPFGCHPTSSHTYYTYDEKHLIEYLKSCKEEASGYIEKYVTEPQTHEDYISLIGRERFDELRESDKEW